MTNAVSNISGIGTLAGQIPVNADIAIRILRQLLAQVNRLHESGRLHGKIVADRVSLTDGFVATLLPSPEELHFEVDQDPVEAWPPELQTQDLAVLPATISAANTAFAAVGIHCDPRRIDLYQLGALLCYLVTGQTVAKYLHSPKARGKVPASLRTVVDGALGYAANDRFMTCGQMQDALAKAVSTLQPSMITDTPGWGSKGLIDLPKTPADGIRNRSSSAPVNPQEPQVGEPEERETAATPTASSSAARPELTPDVTSDHGQVIDRATSSSGVMRQLGHYRIVAHIGAGGMGDVYKAYEESLDRYVAIKVLPPQLARHEDFVRRFRAEATAVAKLVHPNVVQIHSIGEDAGRIYFAMQFVSGESLADLLHRRGSLPVEECLRIIEQCLAGLGAAHRHGMIHRDIKPGNVLLDHDTQRALLADFGLVKAIGSAASLTATGVVMGTVDYIPPEQARGHKVDGRADLYSIGVLMYQMLSGCLPFAADSPTGVIFQHAYEQPPPLGEAAPDVPRGIADIVTRLMAKNPEHRYQSAEDVLADIAAYRSGRPLAAPARSETAQARAKLEGGINLSARLRSRATRLLAGTIAGAVILASVLLWRTGSLPMTTTYLANPGVYKNLVASSTFPGMPVHQVFDPTMTNWAIDGFTGNNPQGRDEGWVSATLDRTYDVTRVRFAPRKPSGAIDGIDRAYIWLSDAPLGVNVTSAASTAAFLGTDKGNAPDLAIGPFRTIDAIDYPLASTVTGKYLLARFVNTNDSNYNRNLGVAMLLIGQGRALPEP